MLLAGNALFFLKEILPQISPLKQNMLGIARMSMNWRADQLEQILKSNNIQYDPAYMDIIRSKTNSLYTSREFFKLLKFENYDDVDFDDSEGCNVIHNLNELLPTEYHNKYNFVFENGTIEHIFDVKNAVGSIALATQVGGHVLHMSPLDAFNHGFYNFSINFFADFYRVNGFTDFKFYLIRGSSKWKEGIQDIKYEPLPYSHEELFISPSIYTSDFNKLAITFLAKKQEHHPKIQIPTQAAYDRSLNLSSVLNTW